ncbi:MAG TPA: glycosyltransferase family 1 protein [Bacteroidota bacterium]|nr:glycosyltransferase family 1 protein [Bacteroidota bacterium]
MTIAYDVSHIQRRRAGIGRYSLSLLSEILRLDQANHYVLHGWSHSIDRSTLEGLSSSRVSLSIHRIPGFVKRGYWERIRLLPLILFTGRYDIFHSADPFSPPVGRQKLIVTVYDLLGLTHPQYFERSVVRRCRHMAGWMQKADAIIVPSRFALHQCVSLGIKSESKIHIVPPLLERQFSENPDSSDQSVVAELGLSHPYILFVGTIEPRKNIPGLIKAFELLGGHEDVDLVLAGKLGWLSGDVIRQIRLSPKASSIRWLEYVPESALGPLYRRALCFIYPSFAEGYGLPVAEAMACGTPVITSNSSALAEIGEGAVRLVSPESPEEISNAMRDLLHNAQDRASLREAGLRRALEIREASSARAVIRLYESLMRR